MADTFTAEQLARAFKEKFPQYANVPDAQLAAAIVDKYPQYKAGLAGAPPSAPKTSVEYQGVPKILQPPVEKPPSGLYEGIGARLKSNLNPIAAGDYLAKFGQAINRPPYPQGGGLQAIGQTLKETYSKPENVIGDLLGAYIFNSAEGGPQPLKEGAKGAIATTLQRLSGAGREPVLLENIKREAGMAKSAASYAEQVAEANRQSQAAYQQQRYGEDLKQNLDQTYNRVKGKLDGRWDQLRKTPTKSGGGLSILNDELGNAKDLRDGMEIAERKFLQGSPESLKQFRDLTGWIERGAGEGPAGGSSRLTPPTWDEMRTHYTAMGDAMYNRDIPSNVYRALKYMREDVIGTQLQTMADKAGVGEQYGTLLRDHSRFEDDWNNTSSVTRGGGSPLAVARKAPNAATLIPQVTGKTGDLLIQRLAKYQDAGASPATAEAIRRAGTTKVPERPTPPQTPPPVDPAAIRRNKILNYTSRPKSVYDFVPPRLFTEPLLQNRFIREFVAKYPRNEFPVPKAEVPPATPRTESPTDIATRRGPGEATGRSLAEQSDLVRNMRMNYERMKASGDPAMWQQAMRLKDEMDKLDVMQKATYTQTTPQTLSSQGGAGANYSAEQLEAFKKMLRDRGSM